MKLGYLVSQYPAVSHTFVLREVRALRQRGIDVRVVSVRRCDRPMAALSTDEAEEAARTFSIMGAGVRHALLANLRVCCRHPRGYLRGLVYAWSLSRGTPKLIALYTAYFLEAMVAGDHFERHGVRDIHTHFSSTVLLILARTFRVRYSLTLHGSGEFVDVVGFHLAEKVAGATFTATVSRYGMSQVMNASDPAHWQRIVVLPLGIDVEAFRLRDARGQGARPADQPFRLISVGRLTAAKGYPILIEATALLGARGREVTLTIVGEGPQRAVLERLIRLRGLTGVVRLAGACNHDRVVSFYGAADAFVLSSFLEGVPVVLMEAMAMELPCIATWITGIPEIIEGDREGLLVPPASADMIADAVERLMDNPEEARELGRAARSKIIGKYALERNVERLAGEFSSRWGYGGLPGSTAHTDLAGPTVPSTNLVAKRSARRMVSDLVRRLALHSGASAHLARRQRRPRILMFHAVGGDGEQTVYPYQQACSTEVFEAEIRYLLRHFTIVPLDHVIERIEGNRAGDGQNELALTFDDGLRNTAETAYPILRKLGVPATFFVCPGLLDSGQWQWSYECPARMARLSQERREALLCGVGAPTTSTAAVMDWMSALEDSYRRTVVQQIREATKGFEPTSVERFNFDLMTWDDVKLLDTSLVAIGSHTLTHPVLSRTDREQMRREIVESKRMLEDRLARPVSYFCYPDGAHNPEVVEVVRQTYRAAVTTRPGLVMPGQDRWLLPRIGAGEEDVHDLAWRLHRPNS